MKSARQVYFMICLVAIALPVPLGLVLMVLAFLPPPLQNLYEWVFYLSLNDGVRGAITRAVGWTSGIHDKVVAGLAIAELQFLILGILVCLVVAIIRRRRGARPALRT